MGPTMKWMEMLLSPPLLPIVASRLFQVTEDKGITGQGSCANSTKYYEKTAKGALVSKTLRVPFDFTLMARLDRTG